MKVSYVSLLAPQSEYHFRKTAKFDSNKKNKQKNLAFKKLEPLMFRVYFRVFLVPVLV